MIGLKNLLLMNPSTYVNLMVSECLRQNTTVLIGIWNTGMQRNTFAYAGISSDKTDANLLDTRSRKKASSASRMEEIASKLRARTQPG